MSYNTRNNATRRGVAQIMYRQQQPARPGLLQGGQSQNLGPSQAAGYNQQYTSGANPSFVPQSKPAAPPGPPAKPSYEYPGMRLLYISAEDLRSGNGLAMPMSAPSPTASAYQQTQQQKPLEQQQQKAPLVPQQQPLPAAALQSTPLPQKQTPPLAQQQPAVQPMQTPPQIPQALQSILSESEDLINNEAAPDVTKSDIDVDDTSEKKHGWSKKKTPGYKINRKVKRRRQNARLRKILQPKNAIMVLNELRSGVKFTFTEHPTPLTQSCSFIVNAEVDGKTHLGQGLSKPLAKQNAAENALKALLLEKMTLAAQAGKTDTNESMDIDNTNDDIDDLKPEDDDKPGAPEEEVPWGSLASFALYKLFTDWQNQGTYVPIAVKPVATQPMVPSVTSKVAPMKALPENPTDRHPVMLLSQMRPGVRFTELERTGTAPNLVFKLEVTVEGVSYEGVARNKKEAKREAAKAALAGCLGITYE